MYLANTLSSKFYSCPQRFAFWPTVHFLDNLSAAEVMSSDTPAARKGLFTKYLVNRASHIFSAVVIAMV